MPAPKKHPRYGGRAKGTPNKITAAVRDIIKGQVTEYFTSGQYEKDLEAMDPKDRALVNEKYFQYIMPKLQATSLDVSEGTKVTIEDKLRELGGEDDE